MRFLPSLPTPPSPSQPHGAPGPQSSAGGQGVGDNYCDFAEGRHASTKDSHSQPGPHSHHTALGLGGNDRVYGGAVSVSFVTARSQPGCLTARVLNWLRLPPTKDPWVLDLWPFPQVPTWTGRGQGAGVSSRLTPLPPQESQNLFCCLYRSWCHNPVTTVSLCFLTQNYRHAYDLIQKLYPSSHCGWGWATEGQEGVGCPLFTQQAGPSAMLLSPPLHSASGLVTSGPPGRWERRDVFGRARLAAKRVSWRGAGPGETLWVGIGTEEAQPGGCQQAMLGYLAGVRENRSSCPWEKVAALCSLQFLLGLVWE